MTCDVCGEPATSIVYTYEKATSKTKVTYLCRVCKAKRARKQQRTKDYRLGG